jgi:hypothetical protein
MVGCKGVRGQLPCSTEEEHMSTILPFVQDQSAFAPESVQAMSAAFDEVCQALRLNGDYRARETIATRIVDLARRGEHDANRLRDRVLREANGGSQPPQPVQCWPAPK